MSIHILVLIVVVIVLISIRSKITRLTQSLERKMEVIKAFITHPNILATSVGKVFLDRALNQLAKIFRK